MTFCTTRSMPSSGISSRSRRPSTDTKQASILRSCSKMKNLLQLHFYAEKEGKKHASLWVNLLCGSLAIYSLLRPGKLNQSCGSNQPTAAFFRLLCFVHLPQKVRGIFALKMRKTGSAAVRSTTAEPVFVDFTVFWAIFALKARKLPDLSGRQIRQLIWCERGDLNSHVG